jgi:hypothetical protein
VNADTDLFGAPVLPPLSAKRKKYEPRGYACRPGSGPAGETCGTCAYAVGIGYHDKRYYKCRKIEFRWTHGPGTDIRLKSPACKLWEREK